MAMMCIAPVFAQDSDDAAPAENSGIAAAEKASAAEETFGARDKNLVEVDRIEEMLEGGFSMVCLGLLSVGLMAFLLERFMTLR